MDEAGGHVLTSARAEYASLRSLAERAAAQVDDEAFFRPLGDDGNSIALLMKHVGGNLRSRWTDFLTADGEKPDRQRDLEFERQPADSRDRVLEIWNQGWRAVDATLEGLAPDDLGQDVVIRGERQSAARALMRSLAHTAGHVHQVVMLARHWQGRGWRTLSIARGQSEQFRQQMIDRQTGR